MDTPGVRTPAPLSVLLTRDGRFSARSEGQCLTSFVFPGSVYFVYVATCTAHVPWRSLIENQPRALLALNVVTLVVDQTPAVSVPRNFDLDIYLD